MIKSLIPGTAAYSRKHFQKFIRKKARGHDVLMLVEWADGKVTEIGADLHPEMDGWYELANGLVLCPIGEGTDPMDWHGVPTIRAHAQIACPISTTAALQAEMEDADEFDWEIVHDDEGNPVEAIRAEIDAGPATNGHGANGDAMADGGVAEAGEAERRYDLRPPSQAIGYTFGLESVKQYAPNAISANQVRRAVEYGKESERNAGELLRVAAYGFGAAVGLVLLLGLLYIIAMSVLGGGGGGGGSAAAGSTTNLGYLLLAVGPTSAMRALRETLFSEGQE